MVSPGRIVERERERDATQRALTLLAGQNRALELVARGAPLAEVLEFLSRLIEAQAPGVLCSVLLLEGDRLRHGAGPSLPEAYKRVIDGVTIGPAVGSCGTAAYTRRPVIVGDIATHPLWEGYASLALVHGLRACWSTPIFSSRGDVLGTFALYRREPGGPEPWHLSLVEVATHLAGIAIERRRSDEAIAEQNRRLVEEDRRKDEFLATLAHELRNPLAPIVCALDLLRAHGKGDPAVDRYCGIISRQTQLMKRLVEDLLDVSRVARGTVILEKDRITAADAVARAVEASRPTLDARGHHLSVVLPEAPITLDADPVRLAQILSNLLNNAAKYTPPGGHVEVRAARRGGEVELTVRDDGIGIPADMLERVFDLFVQADERQAPGGLGIGLTLVKRLVELHGGRVEARSDGPGRGTTMIVRLPAAA